MLDTSIGINDMMIMMDASITGEEYIRFETVVAFTSIRTTKT